MAALLPGLAPSINAGAPTAGGMPEKNGTTKKRYARFVWHAPQGAKESKESSPNLTPWRYRWAVSGTLSGYKLSAEDIENKTLKQLREIFTVKRNAIKQPFSPEWETAWHDVAAWHGVGDLFEQFCARHGITFLESLTKKKVNPNFVLALLVIYFWNEVEPASDYHELDDILERLRAVNITRDIYWRLTKDDGKRLQMVEDSLCALAESIENSLRQTDFKPSPKDRRSADGPPKLLVGEVVQKKEFAEKKSKETRKRASNDKANRFIFTIYEHLVKQCGSPQWASFLDLLHAAELMRVKTWESPDRRIKPRVIQFKKDHPKEARFIRKVVVPQAVKFQMSLINPYG